MALPTFETLKILTQTTDRATAIAQVAMNTDMTPREVGEMVAKGRKWLEGQAVSLKSRPPSARRDAVLCAARGAWLIAGEGT